MKSTYTVTLVGATALLAASNVAAFVQVIDGCYSSTTGLTVNSTSTFNSIGYCSTQCLGLGMATMAMNYQTCYCGNNLPPTSMVADNSSCATTCPGYPPDLCGGTSLYSVYLTGLKNDVSNAAAAASDTSSASSAKTTSKPSTTASATPSVVTLSGQTVVVTASSSATGTSSATSAPSSSPSKAGVAAGFVIGIVALAAIAGCVYLFIRNRRRREVEEEYRRNAAVSDFIHDGKPPSSSAGASFNDMRLDPAVMAQRRMSDGSIADNQDYSRRILKVTNA